MKELPSSSDSLFKVYQVPKHELLGHRPVVDFPLGLELDGQTDLSLLDAMAGQADV